MIFPIHAYTSYHIGDIEKIPLCYEWCNSIFKNYDKMAKSTTFSAPLLFSLDTSSRSICQLFLRALSFKGTTKRAQKFLIQFLNYFLFLNSLERSLLFELCNEIIFLKTFPQLWIKTRDRFVSLFFVFPKSQFSIFASQVRSQFRGYFCITLSNMGRIEKNYL